MTGERATALIRPVKTTWYDHELHCDVRHVVGFMVECRCDWRSATHPTMQAARAALTGHRAECEGRKPEVVPATSETGS